MEQLYELAVKGGGIWCVLCIHLIIMQNRKYSSLETWVREKVTTALSDNTAVMKEVKEKLDADKR